jgi:alginate O-acetyltransferase complex protein AlgI
MLFNSIVFIVFFFVTWILFWSFRNKFHLRQWILLGSGFVFYGWWDWRFLGLLVFSASVDFIAANYISKSKIANRKKTLLWLSISVNLLILFVFKYYDFFISSFQESMALVGIQSNVTLLKIVLPVGISFYTFQAMSYVIDIYKKQVEPCRSYRDYITYICFFPQLVAGPIERANFLLPQFYTPKKMDVAKFENGLALMLFGLFKKVVIADNISLFVDHIYNAGDYSNAYVLWSAVILFSIQIYTDFSGYCDIAKGVAILFDFDLTYNFNLPYFSTSFKEFWSRWHITLSTWFRDYVYIPLGGNKKSKFRNALNIFATFILSGLWHGANYTFLLWGFLNALGRYLETLFRKPNWLSKVKFLSIPIMFILVSLLWVLFRSTSIHQAYMIITNLWFQSDFNTLLDKSFSIYKSYRFILALIAMVFGLFAFEFVLFKSNKKSIIDLDSMLFKRVSIVVLVFIIFMLGRFDNANSFIYFQF